MNMNDDRLPPSIEPLLSFRRILHLQKLELEVLENWQNYMPDCMSTWCTETGLNPLIEPDIIMLLLLFA